MLACGLHWNAQTCAHTTQTYADVTHMQEVLDKDTMYFVYSHVKAALFLLSTDCCSEVSRQEEQKDSFLGM